MTLGYGQLSNLAWSLMLEIIGNFFSDIYSTLAKDFNVSYSLIQSSQISKADDPILTTQSSSRTSCLIQYMT